MFAWAFENDAMVLLSGIKPDGKGYVEQQVDSNLNHA